MFVGDNNRFALKHEFLWQRGRFLFFYFMQVKSYVADVNKTVYNTEMYGLVFGRKRTASERGRFQTSLRCVYSTNRMHEAEKQRHRELFSRKMFEKYQLLTLWFLVY